jgi:hypothetical protein
MVVVIKPFESRIRNVEPILIYVNKYFLRKDFIIHDYFNVCGS